MTLNSADDDDAADGEGAPVAAVDVDRSCGHKITDMSIYKFYIN